jgi:hypothetical protein
MQGLRGKSDGVIKCDELPTWLRSLKHLGSGSKRGAASGKHRQLGQVLALRSYYAHGRTFMNPHRARKKIVAYAITSFMALCTAALGLALGYSALADRKFLLHGDRAALDACLNQPAMDCDPRQWQVLLGMGAVLLVVGSVFLARLGRRLWRVVRA